MTQFNPADLSARLQGHIAVQPNGCWEWTHTLETNGYGQISIKSRLRMAHRVVYEALVDVIPVGLTLDHLCRNRRCVNPGHLDPVTMRENTLRGFSPSAINARKTHCPQGHEYTPENTYAYPKKGRTCRTCAAAYAARIYVPTPRKPRPLSTHCRSGHEYTPENTRIARPPGEAPYRVCRACERASQTERRRKVGVPARNWRTAA